MLKIKDNVDLKELEKYGFEEVVYSYNYYPNKKSSTLKNFSHIRIADKGITFVLVNSWWSCKSIEELEKDFIDIKKSYDVFKIKIGELIKADLIEKVDD